RDINIEAIGLAALYALEVDMFMLVRGVGTGVAAERILDGAAVIEHLMDQAAIKESLQRTVNSNPVDLLRDLTLDISMRQCIVLFQEQSEHFLPRRRRPQPEAFQESVRALVHCSCSCSKLW